MEDIDLDELATELSEFATPQKVAGRSALEQRIIAGYEEIERFVDQHSRLPEHGEGREIFERLYAVRLERLRTSAECRKVLKDIDKRGLLGLESGMTEGIEAADEPDLNDLSASLSELAGPDDAVTRLVHVRPAEDRKAAEEVANRKKCDDFEIFRPIFEQVQKDLDEKTRQTIPFVHEGGFNVGDLFILDGQKVYVHEVGEIMMKDFGREDSRLRVIFDNGTESNMLLRSLQRALYKREHSRRILPRDSEVAPLFSGSFEDGDVASGTVYVLCSKSDHPFIAKHRAAIHKIGVTGGDAKTRVANARKDSTYLLADVELAREYKLANINRKALEGLLHRVFASARLDLAIPDRFGAEVGPSEWFLVPLPAIDEAVARIMDGSINQFQYELNSARFIPIQGARRDTHLSHHD